MMNPRDRTLAAGRFTPDESGRWLDLGTGRRVHLRVLPSLDATRHGRWLERSSALFGAWHPHLLELVDFGVLPDGRRFEAVPDSTAARPGAAPQQILRSASAFLAALGLTAGRLDSTRVRTSAGRLVFVADQQTGWPLAANHPGSNGDGGRARVPGVRLQPRAALQWVLSVLDSAGAGGPRGLALRAAPGAGWRTLQRLIAREARVRGFVPLAAAALRVRPTIAEHVVGRHVLVIDDGPPEGAGCGLLRDRVDDLLMRSGLRGLHGCVVLSVVRSGASGAIEIDPLPPSSLVRMLVGPAPSPRVLDGLARRAGGNPGRFLDLLSSGFTATWDARPSRDFRVREARSAYGQEAGEAVRPVPTSPRLRERQQEAFALVARGRHAAACRLLRTAIASHDRQGDHESASAASLSLGLVLLDRGRVRDAAVWCERAASADRLETCLPGATALASALVELGEFARAEGLCRTVILTARREGRAAEEGAARLAVARTLLWRGRPVEAAAELTHDVLFEPRLTCAARSLQAQVALARGRLDQAGALASRALEAAGTAASPGDVIDAIATAGAVAAMASDAEAARTHVQEAWRAARRERLPLAALRARLIVADAWLQSRRPTQARALTSSLGRRLRALPPLVRARTLGILGASGDAESRQAARRFADTTGAVLAAERREGPDMSLLEDATGLMVACQEADAPDAALVTTCQRLVDHLGAHGAAIVARDGDAPAILARIGPPWPCFEGGAARALATGAAIAPHLGACGVEGAVAIRYGGTTIGAVTCRWPADARIEEARAAALLATAAAACAPAVRAALDARVVAGPGQGPTAALLGASESIEAVRTMIVHAARAPFAVLIEGESGTGKELVARLIHDLGPRRARRFSAVNCAALGDDLLEAELFGHARGAFTGAVAERAGLFEESNGGTLLLDEVGDLSPRAQAKLLRVLQEGEVRRLGENLPRRVDVRVVAATNRPLAAEVAAGRFRADLRYRLDVIRVEVPPLRERAGDVPLLAAHFWREACARTGSRLNLAVETLAALARYDWPGNVRELQNVMASLAVQAGLRGRVRADCLPAHIAGAGLPAGGTLEAARASFDRRLVRAALAQAGGHRGRAARALGISRQGLAKLMKRLNLELAG